jgi:hypothetical protein
MSGTITIHDVAASYGDSYVPEFKRLLNQYAKPTTGNFLEWGAGHTTGLFVEHLEKVGCKRFVSMDDYGPYMETVAAEFKDRPWFHPVVQNREGMMRSQQDPELAYSTHPLIYGEKFDFIYIDGRRRMECAMTAALLCHETTTVVIHDYKRGRYQTARVLYDIMEDGPQFRVMRLRREILLTIAAPANSVMYDVRRFNGA